MTTKTWEKDVNKNLAEARLLALSAWNMTSKQQKEKEEKTPHKEVTTWLSSEWKEIHK
jgi:hypothetical protein